jgi:outer membrane protein assembly factor BamD
MNKILVIILLLLFAGCGASKQAAFDPVARFSEAEELMRKESFEKARAAYQEIQEKAPDKSYNADIMLRVADTYFGEEKFDEALVEYQAFLNFHPVNKNASYAQYQVAMCSYKELPTVDRDPEITRTALKEFEKLLRKYPKSAYEEPAGKFAAICREQLAEYELYVERFYYKKGSFRAAIGRAEKLLKDFPESMTGKDALYYAGLSYVELGERAQALKTLETLVQKYPSMQDTVGPSINKLKKP